MQYKLLLTNHMCKDPLSKQVTFGCSEIPENLRNSEVPMDMTF